MSVFGLKCGKETDGSSIDRLIAYFVVFYNAGFSPSDAVRAQRAGGNTNLFSLLMSVLLKIYVPPGYFQKGAPDFINSRGQVINADQQIDALAQAQSIVYLSIFIHQCFNVFAVKARLTFPFGRRVVSNKWNFIGIVCGASLGIFVIYTPPLHVVFGGSFHLLPYYWFIPAAFGCVLLAWASIRVVILRRNLEDKKVKDIKGLMMCKCSVLWLNGSPY